MNQEWLNSKEFKALPPMKQALLRALLTEGTGKPTEEVLPAFMKANSELNKRGMGFTDAEQTLLMEAMMQSMSPAEKQKFAMLQSMMKMKS